MFVESSVRFLSLVNLLVNSRVRSVEPAALARALRMLPRSKPATPPNEEARELMTPKPAPNSSQ